MKLQTLLSNALNVRMVHKMSIDDMSLREEIAREIGKIVINESMSVEEMRDLAVDTARGADNFMTQFFERQSEFE